jgi:adsorption protein B
MSVPRLIVGNVLNGLATFRALKVFSDSRRGRAAVRWDNTQHLEGIGDMGGEDKSKKNQVEQETPIEEILAGLMSGETDPIVKALKAITPGVAALPRAEIVAYIRPFSTHGELRVRAAVAQVLGKLDWPELTPTLFHVLNDGDWVVRSNAARSLLERPLVGALLEQAFIAASPRSVTALIRVIEQDRRRQRRVFELIIREKLSVTKATIVVESPILRGRLSNFLEEIQIDPREYAAIAGGSGRP